MEDLGSVDFDRKIHFLSVDYAGTRAGTGKHVVRYFTSVADARDAFARADEKGKYVLLCERVANPDSDEEDFWFAFDWSERLNYDYSPKGRGIGFRQISAKASAKRFPKRYEPIDPRFVRPVVAAAK